MQCLAKTCETLTPFHRPSGALTLGSLLGHRHHPRRDARPNPTPPIWYNRMWISCSPIALPEPCTCVPPLADAIIASPYPVSQQLEGDLAVDDWPWNDDIAVVHDEDPADNFTSVRPEQDVTHYGAGLVVVQSTWVSRKSGNDDEKNVRQVTRRCSEKRPRSSASRCVLKQAAIFSEERPH